MSDADGYWIWLDNVDQRSGRVNHLSVKLSSTGEDDNVSDHCTNQRHHYQDRRLFSCMCHGVTGV